MFVLTACGKDENKLEVPSNNVTVIDGNTLQIRGSKNKVETVKLISIEAPVDNQPFAPEAKNFLQNMVQNSKTITLEKAEVTKDSKNQMVVYVYADNKSVQEAMLKNGFARVANVAPPLDDFADVYQSAEKEAKSKNINIWSLPNYVKADGFYPDEVPTLIVASTNSDVYHKTTCNAAKQILDKNKIYFKTEQEAIASGRVRSKEPGCWDKK